MSARCARLLPLFVALLAVTAAACTPVPEDDELVFRDTCPTCAGNSPEIDDAPFPELSLSGEPNSAGVSLVGLRDPTNDETYPFATNIRDEMVVYKDSETILYEGDDLIGWELVLEKDGVEVAGTIAAYDDDVPGWTDQPRPFTTYAITFPSTDNPLGARNVCPTYWNNPGSPVLTIIRGETYDRVHKRVGEIDTDWVTFACADQAAYKAKALGYHQGELFPGTAAPATLDQQNATLKMITADYCGTGHSFTEQGTAIQWANTAGTVTIPFGTVLGPLEAVWGQSGAICLDEPRLVPRSEVDAECPGIPSCYSIDWENMPHEWVTWTPLQ